MPATLHYNKKATYNGNTANLPLSDYISRAMKSYLDSLGDELPENVYEMVLHEIELPLIMRVMEYCRYNQSQAARILGINRGTFRKKLSFYGML